MNTYLSGQSVTIWATFQDPDTKATLLPMVTLRVTDPAGVETDFTSGIAVSAAGRYSIILNVVTPGVWKYRWESAAPMLDAIEGRFFVSATSFPAD